MAVRSFKPFAFISKVISLVVETFTSLASLRKGADAQSLFKKPLLLSDGSSILYGNFLNYGGVFGRNFLVKLTPTDEVDHNFCSNIDGKFSTGAVSGVLEQADGKILVWGTFTNFQSKNYIIRLNADGTHDTTFNPTNPSASVDSCALIGTDCIIAGSFTNYNGTTGLNRLVRLNSTGALVSTYSTNASGSTKFSASISVIKALPDGSLLVGGGFTNYGGTTGRNRFIKLNADGTVNATFCANSSDGTKFSGSINDIIVDSSNNILVCGGFLNYGGTTGRNKLIKLSPTGVVDAAFCANATDSAKFGNTIIVNSNISHLCEISSGKYLVGGWFSNYAGVSGRNSMLLLNSTGTTDTAFCNTFVDNKNITLIYGFTPYSNGKVLVVGATLPYSIPFFSTNLAKLDLVTNTFDSTYPPAIHGNFNGAVNCVERHGNFIFVGGSFQNFGGVTGRNYLVCLNLDGSVNTSFCTAHVDGKLNATVTSLKSMPLRGSLLVGGTFSNYPIGSTGTFSNNALCFNINSSTGAITLDESFCTAVSLSSKLTGGVNVITCPPNESKVFLGGSFTTWNGSTTQYFVAFESAFFTYSTAFNTNSTTGSKFNSPVETIFAADTTIFVGGSFVSYNSVANRNRLIALNNDGTLNTTLTANMSDSNKFGAIVRSVHQDSAGEIYVGGEFTSYGGTTGRSYFVKLLSTGLPDTTFCTTRVDNKINGIVHTVFVDGSGNLFIGGEFSNYEGTSGRNRLLKMTTSGSLDSTFLGNAVDANKFLDTVRCVRQFPSGYLVGGNFRNPYGYFIALNSTGAVA